MWGGAARGSATKKNPPFVKIVFPAKVLFMSGGGGGYWMKGGPDRLRVGGGQVGWAREGGRYL